MQTEFFRIATINPANHRLTDTLKHASNEADYQFSLNGLKNLAHDFQVNGAIDPNKNYSERPTTTEIQGLIDPQKGTFSTAKLQSLADKYNVKPTVMQKYVNDIFLQSMGAQ